MSLSDKIVAILVFSILTFILLVGMFVLYILQTPAIKPPNLTIPMSSYMCDGDTGFGNIAICSGPAYDKKGNQWSIMDRAEYQAPDEAGVVNRFIQMTVTDGKKVYNLSGIGSGEDIPDPTAVGQTEWNMTANNNTGLDAKMTIVNDQTHGVSAFLDFI